MKWLACFIFIARVTIPLGVKETYEVLRYQSNFGTYWELRLTNGKTVIVPIMWTVIEEK